MSGRRTLQSTLRPRPQRRFLLQIVTRQFQASHLQSRVVQTLVGRSADPAVVSAFASEADKLRDELREHNVPFTEADVVAILEIGGEAVARNVPDLSADDAAITERVSEAFPQYTRQQRKVVVRCVAEQVEQVIARQSGDGIPPDQRGRTGG